MRTLLPWILLATVLFAQSAWAFEDHPGHFEAGASCEQPAEEGKTGEHAHGAADSHCAHSPVHFLAVHRDLTHLAGTSASGELPPYHPPVSSPYADPPTQPPRA